jgi:glycosyltransferase involved in cell wall biosynthesis
MTVSSQQNLLGQCHTDPLILMVGPSITARGGVASVCAEYERFGIFERLRIRYLGTFERGSVFRKFRVAFSAVLVTLCHLRRGSIVGLHAHAATNASFWRKSIFCMIARLYGVPYILHLHSGDMPAFLARCNRFSRSLANKLISAADRVVVLSPEWAVWLKQISPRAHVEIVPNPVELPPASVGLQRTKAPTVLFLGRLEAAKGIPELLVAFAEVLHILPDAILYLGGEGDFDGVRQRTRNLSIESSVKILGWVSGQSKRDLLSTCWVFALPSHHEGLPVGMLEAMAYGMPCIGTPVGAVPGLLAASGGGVVVPVNQARDLAKCMGWLLNDAELRARMGACAAAHVHENYGTGIVERRLKAIYESLQRKR